MILKNILTVVPVALCVITHAIALVFLLRILTRYAELEVLRFWVPVWYLIRLAGWLIVVHVFEISIWALYYVIGQAMPDVQSALYFSSVTYTTVGYGDLVLPVDWRMVGGIEALTGILMCGLSTGFFFTVVSHMFQSRLKGGTGNRNIRRRKP
jgi:hypothetical protein